MIKKNFGFMSLLEFDDNIYNNIVTQTKIKLGKFLINSSFDEKLAEKMRFIDSKKMKGIR